jgi:hypothetical protein
MYRTLLNRCCVHVPHFSAVLAPFHLQLAFDSEGIALTSTMGFVKNPVSSSSSSSSD